MSDAVFSFPSYDPEDVVKMQGQDPVISRFLHYFKSGRKPTRKEREGETRTVVDIPYEKYLYQSIGAIYVPYMSPIISIGEL